jgi:hypothetical protein
MIFIGIFQALANEWHKPVGRLVLRSPLLTLNPKNPGIKLQTGQKRNEKSEKSESKFSRIQSRINNTKSHSKFRLSGNGEILEVSGENEILCTFKKITNVIMYFMHLRLNLSPDYRDYTIQNFVSFFYMKVTRIKKQVAFNPSTQSSFPKFGRRR